MSESEETLQLLHDAMREDGCQLRILVGAGPSIAAGLPGWEELNRRLLREYLRSRVSELAFSRADLDAMSHRFVQRFGRDAVVDLVRASGKRRGSSTNICEWRSTTA